MARLRRLDFDDSTDSMDFDDSTDSTIRLNIGNFDAAKSMVAYHTCEGCKYGFTLM